MSRIARLSVLGAVTLALVYGVVLDGFGVIGGPPPDAPAEPAGTAPEAAASRSAPAPANAATAAPASSEPAESAIGEPPRLARDVTPPNVLTLPTRPFVDPVREAEEPAAKEEGPAVRRYHRVVVRDAGTLQADGVTIHFAGVAPVAGDRSCTDRAGRSWPCGRVAAAELRLLIRNRAVDCTVVSETAEGVVGTCSAGLRDINGWLVEHGWAEAEGEAYSSEADSAQRDNRGIYLAAWQERGPGGAGVPPLEAFSAPSIIPGGAGTAVGGPPSGVLPELTPEGPLDQ